MDLRVGEYLRSQWFFLLIVAGLGIAIFQAAGMGRRLQARLDSIRSTEIVERSLPPTLSPISGTDSQGQTVEIRFQAEKTLLFVFDPSTPHAPELELSNLIAQKGPQEVSVIGVAATANGWADQESWRRAQFPVVVVRSFQELERNNLIFGPAIVVLSRGGRLEKYWIGPGKLEDPENRSELAEALAMSRF